MFIMRIDNNIEMRKCVLAVFEILILASAGFLIYMVIGKDIEEKYRFRFYTFTLQHVFTFLMILYNAYNYSDNPGDQISWMVLFTTGNFIQFGLTQLYLTTRLQSVINFSEKNLLTEDFAVLTYIHFYYQINIYLGVFSLFSVVMCILFRIQERNQRERVEEVLEKLQEQEYQANGQEEACSICLNDYQKDQKLYRLVCGHIFHKDCFKDWLQQKISCPLCRSTTLYQSDQ